MAFIPISLVHQTGWYKIPPHPTRPKKKILPVERKNKTPFPSREHAHIFSLRKKVMHLGIPHSTGESRTSWICWEVNRRLSKLQQESPWQECGSQLQFVWDAFTGTLKCLRCYTSWNSWKPFIIHVLSLTILFFYSFIVLLFLTNLYL